MEFPKVYGSNKNKQIEFTLIPSTTESQKLIVQTLIDKYAPNAKVKESSLGKVVRLK